MTRVARRPIGPSPGGITVTHHLFDIELDGCPPILDVRGGLRPSEPKSGIKGASPGRTAAPGATFGEWLAGAGLSQVVGLGLAVGLVVAIPLAMALQADRSHAPRPANPPPIRAATAGPFRP